MLIAGGACIPRTIHELIAHLACRLARWDDRYLASLDLDHSSLEEYIFLGEV